MYFTHYHKKMFKAISKEKINDLNSFFNEYIQRYCESGKLEESCEFADISLRKDTQIEVITADKKGKTGPLLRGKITTIIKGGAVKYIERKDTTDKEGKVATDQEDKIVDEEYTRLSAAVYRNYIEYFSILKFLEENELILLVEDKADFVPIFLWTGKKLVPFDDLWVKMAPYMHKKIVLRKGFKKFKSLGYRTYEEAIERRRKLAAIIIGIMSLVITILLSLLVNWHLILSNIRRLFF